EIISIEVINTIAVAKTHVPIFEYNYYDLLSLSLIDGNWVIVNKLLTHVNE
ncbi:MAG: nuclear transport factor 2 family protein, partial [Flavobacterium johnsoniae]